MKSCRELVERNVCVCVADRCDDACQFDRDFGVAQIRNAFVQSPNSSVELVGSRFEKRVDVQSWEVCRQSSEIAPPCCCASRSGLCDSRTNGKPENCGG